MGVNVTIISGHLTKHPVAGETQAGKSMASFVVAVNEKLGPLDKVTFVPVRFFDRIANAILKGCTLGSHVMVEGRLELIQYDVDGDPRQHLELSGRKITFLGRPNEKSEEEKGIDEEGGF